MVADHIEHNFRLYNENGLLTISVSRAVRAYCVDCDMEFDPHQSDAAEVAAYPHYSDEIARSGAPDPAQP